MIAVERASRPARARDAKRRRVVLVIGERSLHMTAEEAERLLLDLERILLAPPIRLRRKRRA